MKRFTGKMSCAVRIKDPEGDPPGIQSSLGEEGREARKAHSGAERRKGGTALSRQQDAPSRLPSLLRGVPTGLMHARKGLCHRAPLAVLPW